MNPEDSTSPEDSKDITNISSPLAISIDEGPGTTIGPYKLLAKLGEGGFGVVWAAEQREPVKQRVALKIIKIGMDTKQVVARFEAERQALAMMSHPNIAKVLGAGSTDSGRPYFCLELIRGIPITQYCDENKLPTNERLELFIKVCRAIQHAHQKGIVHRDIKPSNILVSIHDGEAVPKVIDFGIAKATQQELTEKTIYTQLQQFIGTPAYMSPEQAVMSGLDIDTRSDIYSLGVLLYELLTGRTPFDAKELMESGLDGMRQIIREREPERPSTKLSALQNEERTTTAQRRSSEFPNLISVLRGDLDWIAMKALEKDRTRRYDTANGLAMDIRRHLDNEPVTARPPSALYRLEKAWRRNKLATTAAGAVAASLILGLGLSIFSLSRERDARTAAVDAQLESDRRRAEAEQARVAEAEQRRLAQENGLKARQLQYAAQVHLAHQAWNDGDFAGARELLELQRPGPSESDLRGFEWRYLWELCQDQSVHTLQPFIEPRNVGWWESGLISFSSDGSLLAIADGKIVRIIDFDTRQELKSLELQGDRVKAFAFSPTDNDQLALSDGNSVLLWDVMANTPASVISTDTNSAVEALAFSPGGEKLAIGTGGGDEGGRMELWDVKTRTRDWRADKPAHFDGKKVEPTLCMTFSRDGGQIVSGGGDTKIKFWDAITGDQIGAALEAHTAYVLSLNFSPDGRLLASAGIDGRILVWDFATRQKRPEFLGHRGVVKSVTFTPDGRMLVSGGEDSTIRCWDLTSSKQISILRGHTAMIHSLALSPTGQSVVSVSDKTVKVWNPPPHVERNVLDQHEGWLNGAVLSPDGKIVAVPDYHAHHVKLWDVHSRSFIGNLPTPAGGHRSLAFSPDGRWLASVGQDRMARLWDWRQRKEAANYSFDPGVWSVSFSFDSRLLSAVVAHRLKVWRTASGEEIQLIRGFDNLIDNATFSPKEALLATSRAMDGIVNLWDIQEGKEVASISMNSPSELAYSPDGSLLAVRTPGPSISLVDVKQATIVRQIRVEQLQAMAISNDNKTLATAGRDGKIRLWNIASGQTALTLHHIGPATGVSFSEDGTMLATSGADATVRLWPAPSP